MKLLKGIDYTLVSTNATNEFKSYSSGMSLRKDEKISYKGKAYQAIREISSLNSPPDNDENVTTLVDIGAINPLKFKDLAINTQTRTSGDLELVIDMGKSIFDRINLLNIEAIGVEIYKNNELLTSTDLRTAKAKSWLEFFLASFKNSFKKDTSIALLPNNGQIKIVLKAGANGAGLGHLSIGRGIDIGECLWEPRISVLDYSRKKKDDWGNITLVKGKTATLLDIKAVVYTAMVDEVKDVLRQACGELVTIIADERDKGIKSLSVHGFIKEFGISVNNAQTSELNLSFEGVI